MKTSKWKVGDQVAWPEELPIGTELDCHDKGGNFQMKRDNEGWLIVGGYRRFTWETVVKLWLPATITKLGTGS